MENSTRLRYLSCVKFLSRISAACWALQRMQGKDEKNPFLEVYSKVLPLILKCLYAEHSGLEPIKKSPFCQAEISILHSLYLQSAQLLL